MTEKEVTEAWQKPFERRYVRIIETHANGIVEFQFALGEPEMFVELMLPQAAFEAFCSNNQVIRLESQSQSPADVDERADSPWQWNLHDASRRALHGNNH